MHVAMKRRHPPRYTIPLSPLASDALRDRDHMALRTERLDFLVSGPRVEISVRRLVARTMSRILVYCSSNSSGGSSYVQYAVAPSALYKNSSRLAVLSCCVSGREFLTIGLFSYSASNLSSLCVPLLSILGFQKLSMIFTSFRFAGKDLANSNILLSCFLFLFPETRTISSFPQSRLLLLLCWSVNQILGTMILHGDASAKVTFSRGKRLAFLRSLWCLRKLDSYPARL